MADAFGDHLESRLRRLWTLDGHPFEEVAAQFEMGPDELLDDLAELLEIGLLSVINGTLRMTPPRTALAELLENETQTLQTTVARLLRMGGIVTRLGDESPSNVARPTLGPGESWLDAQVLRGLPSGEEFKEWIAAGGDLRFLRPYHWRLPSEPVMAEAFAGAVAQGWNVRCIYPTEALRLARHTLDQHAAFGEQVRLLPQVPYQLALIGSGLALVVSGVGDTARTLVLRDPVLVRLLDQYFDLLWTEAVVMPELEETWGREDELQMLLGALARGARDEQIARTLGISLRTVRRRVADLMVELGAETRFQAGVEAARRGWL